MKSSKGVSSAYLVLSSPVSVLLRSCYSSLPQVRGNLRGQSGRSPAPTERRRVYVVRTRCVYSIPSAICAGGCSQECPLNKRFNTLWSLTVACIGIWHPAALPQGSGAAADQNGRLCYTFDHACGQKPSPVDALHDYSKPYEIDTCKLMLHDRLYRDTCTEW